MYKNFFQYLKIIIVGTVISVGISYVYAWTAPTGTPPTGNVSAPINTSATAQTKAGDFTVGGLLSGVNATFSRIGIGATADPSVSLNVAGTIKTTGFQLATGAGFGKVLTSDSLGNTSWTDPVQATGGSGGLYEEVYYTSPGTYDFLVPSWMTSLVVEVVGGGGGGAIKSGSTGPAGNDGGTSSFGPNGAPIISATGGGGGSGGAFSYYAEAYYCLTQPVNGANGSGVGGTLNLAPYSFMSASFASGGAGVSGSGCNSSVGGQGGYSKKLISVTPGQTMKVIVGAGGASSCIPWFIGLPCTPPPGGKGGYVHLIYPLAPTLANSQTFASNGTFTVPAGVTSITVEVWGGGGAGGPGGASQNYTSYWTYTAGGGGGSGGYAKSIFTVTPGATYDVVVGGGGQGIKNGWWVTSLYNKQGNSGSASSFGSGTKYVSATGGTGGVSFDTYCGGDWCNGNISCTTDWNASGGTATNGNFLNTTGSIGNVCHAGIAGAGGGAAGGKSFGTGGNGGASGATTINYPGGNGAVVVSW